MDEVGRVAPSSRESLPIFNSAERSTRNSLRRDKGAESGANTATVSYSLLPTPYSLS